MNNKSKERVISIDTLVEMSFYKLILETCNNFVIFEKKAEGRKEFVDKLNELGKKSGYVYSIEEVFTSCLEGFIYNFIDLPEDE